MKELTIQEMREIQLDMLDILDAFCEENNIRYYLCGGSLLGAIRHRGYIPWDDDIDVNIPRPDLDKLLKLSDGKLRENIIIEKPGDRDDKSLIFYRVYNTSTKLISKNEKLGIEGQKHIFVDIFPVDALPKSRLITRWIYIWSGLLISLGNMASVKKVVGTSSVKRFIKSILFPVARIHTPGEWAVITDRYARKRNYNKAKFIGVINTEASHRFHERILKTEYEPIIDVEFEQKRYPAPKGYDTYLRNLYGENYMDLPPISAQKSHHDFTAYLISEGEKI